MLLTSVSDVKLFLEKTDTSHDALLSMIVEYVSDRIEKFLNRNLKKEYRTQYFNVQAKKKRYFLDSYPIDTSATITITLDSQAQVIDEDFYVWHNDGIIEFDYYPSYIEPKQIIMSWLGGYAATTITVAGEVKEILEDIPDTIKLAVVLQSAYVFRNRLNLGATAVTLPNGSVQGIFSGDLLPEVKSMLQMYRKSTGDNR